MTTWIEANLGFSPDLTRRIAATIVLIIVIVVLRWFVARWLSRTVSDGELLFRSRKALTYISTAVLVLLLTWIWLPFVEDLGTFIGLLSAGLVIALADVFMDLAGWVFIMFRRPFKVGDRIEIDGTAGDVIDIRAFRFTLLEIRNWVDADQATGRVVHVPNGKLFKNAAANYTEGFFHIWHEIPVLITFESESAPSRRDPPRGDRTPCHQRGGASPPPGDRHCGARLLHQVPGVGTSDIRV